MLFDLQEDAELKPNFGQCLTCRNEGIVEYFFHEKCANIHRNENKCHDIVYIDLISKVWAGIGLVPIASTSVGTSCEYVSGAAADGADGADGENLSWRATAPILARVSIGLASAGDETVTAIAGATAISTGNFFSFHRKHLYTFHFIRVWNRCRAVGVFIPSIV